MNKNVEKNLQEKNAQDWWCTTAINMMIWNDDIICW